MQSDVIDLRGKVLRKIDLDDRVFGIEPNQAVVHQAVVTQQANARQGTHDTRTRGEVAGGGKKPYRQKGTGYARQGSKRAPHYKGGGVVFGPHPRSYEKAFPKKMRHLAMRSVLSARAAESALTIVDSITLDSPKTKALVAMLDGLGVATGAVVVLGERSDGLWRAARNLEKVHVVTPNGLCLLDILRLPRLVLTESAVAELTRTLTRDLKPAAVQVVEEPAAPKRRRPAKPAAGAASAEASPRTEAPASAAAAEATPRNETPAPAEAPPAAGAASSTEETAPRAEPPGDAEPSGEPKP
jgi:large subunit ribosomal protein L4